MDRLLRAAGVLDFHGTYVLVAIGIGAGSAALLYLAEVWGSARARRRTERAIAEAQHVHARAPETRT
jgi:hypothetical protein